MTEPTFQQLLDQRADLAKRLSAIQGRINSEDYQDIHALYTLQNRAQILTDSLADLDTLIAEKADDVLPEQTTPEQRLEEIRGEDQ